MQAAPRHWKSKETDPPLGPQEGMQAYGPILNSDFGNCKTIKMCCVKATKFVLIFYRRNKNQIYLPIIKFLQNHCLQDYPMLECLLSILSKFTVEADIGKDIL